MEGDASRGAEAPRPVGSSLAGLGLIMQIGGGFFLIYVLAELSTKSAPLYYSDGLFHKAPWLIGLICAAAALRSAIHIYAGRSLVSGQAGGPRLRPTYLYIAVALAQTALTLVVMSSISDRAGDAYALTAPHYTAATLLLLSWPLALLGLLSLPRLRNSAGGTAGREAAAGIMLLFGLVGGLTALLAVYAAVEHEPSTYDPFGTAREPEVLAKLVLVGVCALLMARSILQVVAGIVGASGNSDAADRALGRYVRFGLMSSLVVAAAILLVTLIDFNGYETLSVWRHRGAEVLFGVAPLLAWPLILRHFFRRQSAPAAVGPSGTEEDASDAKLTSLGWLLLAAGVLQLCATAFRLVPLSESWHPWWAFYVDSGDLVTWSVHNPRPPLWSVATGAVQIWAAIEIICMTDRRRLAAVIYLGLSTAVTLWFLIPQLDHLGTLIGRGLPSVTAIGEIFQVSFWLVAPVFTMILVNRGAQNRAASRAPCPPRCTAAWGRGAGGGA
jgi:hypothetical protein